MPVFKFIRSWIPFKFIRSDSVYYLKSNAFEWRHLRLTLRSIGPRQWVALLNTNFSKIHMYPHNILCVLLPSICYQMSIFVSIRACISGCLFMFAEQTHSRWLNVEKYLSFCVVVHIEKFALDKIDFQKAPENDRNQLENMCVRFTLNRTALRNYCCCCFCFRFLFRPSLIKSFVRIMWESIFRY